MDTTHLPAGFVNTKIDPSYPVTLFPKSDTYYPTPGQAIGVETNEVYGSQRLIVRYDTPPVRKSTGKEEYWPGGVVYVARRDVEGWKD